MGFQLPPATLSLVGNALIVLCACALGAKKRPRRAWAVEARSGERGGWARRFSQDPSRSLRQLKKLEACESHLLSPVTVQFLLVEELLTSAFRFLQSAFALVCCEHLVRIRCGSQSYNGLLYWRKRVYQ